MQRSSLECARHFDSAITAHKRSKYVIICARAGTALLARQAARKGRHKALPLEVSSLEGM
jgi:hypothetical protein